ncbi:MAG: Bax inhibitor-1/YccA family protein [Haloechinothrix sp.]
MRTSSNPAFRNLPMGGAGGYAGFNKSKGGYPGYDMQAPPAAPERPMTVDDVVMKTGASLGVTLLTGIVTAIWAQGQIAAGTSGLVFGAMIGGMLVGLVLALVIIFKKMASGPMTLAYSAAEGVFLGAITGVFTVMFGNAIALQAIIGTAGVFVTMLVVYKTGAVKVTPKLTKWIIGALMGAVILMLANLVLGFFIDGGLGLRDGGPIAIIFSLVVIGIAAFSFLLDFDMADRMIRDAVPAKFAWFVAFGLMVTLVWLYLEILRLLSYFQGE